MKKYSSMMGQGFGIHETDSPEAASAKHTPGPWTVVKTGKTGADYLLMSNHEPIADLSFNGYFDGTIEATVRLIESAPELFNSMRRIANYIPNEDVDYKTHCAALQNAARAAIARAEGRAS